MVIKMFVDVITSFPLDALRLLSVTTLAGCSLAIVANAIIPEGFLADPFGESERLRNQSLFVRDGGSVFAVVAYNPDADSKSSPDWFVYGTANQVSDAVAARYGIKHGVPTEMLSAIRAIRAKGFAHGPLDLTRLLA